MLYLINWAIIIDDFARFDRRFMEYAFPRLQHVPSQKFPPLLCLSLNCYEEREAPPFRTQSRLPAGLVVNPQGIVAGTREKLKSINTFGRTMHWVG